MVEGLNHNHSTGAFTALNALLLLQPERVAAGHANRLRFYLVQNQTNPARAMKLLDIQTLHDAVPRGPRRCIRRSRHHRRLLQFVRFGGADRPDVFDFGNFSDHLRRLSQKETPQADETNQSAINRTGHALNE
jgi:hypothetical protein